MTNVYFKVIISLVIAGFMWSVMHSLEQITKDLRIIAGRYESKPPAGDSEQLIDA